MQLAPARTLLAPSPMLAPGGASAPALAVPPAGRELVRLLYYVGGDPDPEEIRVRSSGLAVGDPAGYASWEDAARAASQLTLGAPGAAAVLRIADALGGARYLAVGTTSWAHPFEFERGEDLPATADEIEPQDAGYVGIVDGARIHRHAAIAAGPLATPPALA